MQSESIDEEVLQQLRNAEFERNDDGILTFSNEATAGQQGIMVCLVTAYPDSKTAAEKERLLNLAIEGMARGTMNHPSRDRVTRAYKEKRLNPFSVQTQRTDNRINFYMTGFFPYGTSAITSLESGLLLVEEGFQQARIFSDDGVFNEIRRDAVRNVDDKKQDPVTRVRALFFNTYFPYAFPLGEEKERAVLEGVTREGVRTVLDEQFHNAFPVVLYSGSQNIADIISSSHPFAGRYSGSRDSSILRSPEVYDIANMGKRDHRQEPGKKMQFLRAYPLQAKPETEAERIAIDILVRIIGGHGIESLLGRELRLERSLVYGINAAYNPELNMMLVRTNHDPAKFDDVVEGTGRLVTSGMQGNFGTFFEQVRTQRMDAMLFQYQNMFSVPHIGEPDLRLTRTREQYVTHATRMTLVERYRRLAELTPEILRGTAAKFFDPAKSQIFTYGGKP